MLPILALTVLAAVGPLTPLRVVHAFEAVGRYAAGDRGVDLAGFPGQTVVSATAGTVLFAGPVAGVGVVSVDLGDGRRLTYEPVTPSVHAGAQLTAGTQLGRLAAGRADCPAPACLHWGLVAGRGATVSYADPLTLLGRAQVRLLPLNGPPGSGRALPSESGHPIPVPSAAARVSPVGTAVAHPAASRVPVEASPHAVWPTWTTGATDVVGSSAALGVAYARRRGRASRQARSP